MPTCFDMLPDRFEQLGDLRAAHMRQGFQRLGYQLKKCTGFCAPQDKRDVLLTWTRHKGPKQDACDRFESAGGRVVVAEEAHIRFVPNGPYPNEQYFSLCLGDHQGFWRSHGRERWASWNIEIAPWRKSGDKVLVREQRGIGSAKVASPQDWHSEAARDLRRYTDRQIEIVTHPKTLKRRGLPVPSPGEQFHGAWCVVTWNSHMGTEALIHGIPVIACGPRFFLSPACGNRLDEADTPRMPGNREAAFQHFAWAQWASSEIASGEAFKRLLGK